MVKNVKSRPNLELSLHDVSGTRSVEGDESLVEPDIGVEFSLLTEQDREELKAGNILAEHHQADSQWSREKEAGHSPKPGPKHGGKEQPERGDSRRLAVDNRLDEAVEGQLDRSEEDD